jgi:sortase (surface protein transpeptidase)
MPVNRWAPAAGVLTLLIGLILIFGSLRPASPASVLPPAVAAVAPSSSASQTGSPVASAPAVTRAPAIPDGYRIKIARLLIDLPIAEGDIERDAVRGETPEDIALHLPGSAVPGDGSNTYIYAHARRGMFLALWNAREGDEVLIVTPDGRVLRYIVSEVHPRVDPTDISWVARTAGERLTLQTSTGPNPGDPRFVVVALPG